MIKIENNLQFKYMIQKVELTSIESKSQILEWRNTWVEYLKKWHSPYKLLIDLSQVKSINPDLNIEISNMFRFFKGMHLQKAAYYGEKLEALENIEFLKNFADEKAAQGFLNIRSQKKVLGADAGFRDQIQIQNHFRQQVMELNFANPVKLDSKEKLELLKSKMSNNLMQWHSHWNLLVDCKNLEFNKEIEPSFNVMIKFFNGFFLQKVKGYAPITRKSYYPFDVSLSRHKAAADLKESNSTKISGDTANCADRKSPKK